ncbi:amino acid transporter [Vulcanimicrobium alpinum]|uniref:Amino acid transporter n=1 Tax=Vulcanimicrobium alpinum TaxID=3016050 RepID=A0AAN1XXZ3_UNVUL|nr:amino acid permease [Vulcanimicrobium alpinum]BDE06307.1 amino acid transporter [Vulcanimicrobium alpinum]
MSFVSDLFATSSVDKLRELSRSKTLRRALTAKDLVAIGLGTMIGGGIFTTIGTGVKGAGPAVILSYLLAGVTSFFAALCYAELGAMVPVAGSAYTYAYATLGKLFAWIIGFALIFEYGISAAPVAQQFSAALQDALKPVIVLPFWAQQSNLVTHGAFWQVWTWDLPHSQVDALGAAFVLGLSLLLSVGIRESATTNNIFVVLKISALMVFIVAGLALFHPGNLADFVPHGLGAIQPFGGAAEASQPIGIIPVAAYVFFSYIGFDTATTTAEECKNPQRDVPLGVIGALAIGTVIYCATAIVLVGAMPWAQIPDKNPLIAALAPLHLPFLNWVITIGILAGTTSVALSSLLGQTRIFFVMARDKMLPPQVAAIHPRFKTPVVTTMITGVAVAILTLIFPLTQLLLLVNIGTLVAFTVVCAGVLYLRRRRPDLPRAFRVPFVPLFPILGIVFSAFLAIFGLSRDTWIFFSIALVIGLVFFFSYGFWRSNPQEIEPVVEPDGLIELA